jgi:putative ABC transport system permease protein
VSRPAPVRGERTYRALLRLYPRHFRERYGDDMLAFYRERVYAGRAPWLEVFPDLIVSALAERFAWLHRDLTRAPSVVRTYSRHRESSMSILRQDLSYALRGMRRRPGFAAIVLATLALGIGANAAIFTVVNAVLLRPLPFAQPDRVVDFAHNDPYAAVSEPEFNDYSRGVTALAKLAAYSMPDITITHDDADPVRTTTAYISRDFFDVAGVKPTLGRAFSAEEFAPHSSARVTMLTHRFWQQELGADPKAVGKTIRIDGTPVTIVGVMPASFTFPSATAAVYTPWRFNPDSMWQRNNHYLRLVGRLADGASIEQARSQATTLALRWIAQYPETYSIDHPFRPSITLLSEHILGPTRPYLVALLGAVGFILLIACVNVANLFLVRGESRRKELAIRTALGASASRMMRQLLTESLVYAIVGAAFGGVLAWVGTRGLIALAPGDLPRADEIGVDARVVIFTIAVTILTGLFFGALPAWRVRRADSAETLREGGKTSALSASGVARRALVVAEIALAVVMLSGAGLLVRSLLNLQAIDLGFKPDRLLTMEVTMPRPRYNDTTSDEFVRQVLAQISRVPGVVAASAVSYLPITGGENAWSIVLDGRVLERVADAPYAKPENVTPDYFRAMSIRLLRGRVFTELDRMGAAPVAVISEGMAKKLWPGVDPIGHTVRMFSKKATWATIVGVVGDVRTRGYQNEVPETMYFPYAQSGQTSYTVPSSMTLVVKAADEPSALAPAVRRIVRAADRTIPIAAVATMDHVVGDSIASRRFATALLLGFALLALVLAGIGIYGVMSYGVSQRRNEIGIRVAMVATPAAIVRLVAGEGGRVTAIGLVLGLGGALVVSRLIQTMLVGVARTDFPTLFGVAATLTVVAACACAIPTRRATSVSPTEALRDVS